MVADGAGEAGNVGMGMGGADVGNGGSGPKCVPESGGRNDEDPMGRIVLRNEGAGEMDESFDEDVFHDWVSSLKDWIGSCSLFSSARH